MRKFKVGDRVAVYGGICNVSTENQLDGEPATVCSFSYPIGGMLRVTFEREFDGSRTWSVHPKQCRKLLKKPRRRLWVSFDTCWKSGPYHHYQAFDQPPDLFDAGSELVEFVEVRRKK